jgi:hypothetical protein
MSRPGLYFLAFLAVLNSCSADDNSRKALLIAKAAHPEIAARVAPDLSAKHPGASNADQ